MLLENAALRRLFFKIYKANVASPPRKKSKTNSAGHVDDIVSEMIMALDDELLDYLANLATEQANRLNKLRGTWYFKKIALD